MKFEATAIFLNRTCPRNCVQCGISDGSKKPLTIFQWKVALSILRNVLGTEFFLFLGTEPLMFREGLVELVEWFSSQNLFYGFYSTSPEPLFSMYKQSLVNAGLQNWSAGIDGLPGMATDDNTKRKIEESIVGLQWMAERGVQTHTLTTIHKRNLHNILEILEWCQGNIPGVQSSINFIEWQRSPRFDFFAPKTDMKNLCWDGSPEEWDEIRRVMSQIKSLSRVEGMIIQTPDTYLDQAHEHYNLLNQHCNGVTGPGVDCDGTMRLCGYSTGSRVQKWSIFDLDQSQADVNQFLWDWTEDLMECPGCHWIFQDMLKGDLRILDPKSGFHEERWNEEGT